MSKVVILNTLSDARLPALLQEGKVGIIPTDTLYGLVCTAADESAVKRLYGMKKRGNKPGTVIAASVQQLVDMGMKARYLKAVSQFWPGAVSIVIPSYGLSYIHLGKGSIAVRIPDNPALTDLLKRTGPLLTTSANLPSLPPATTIKEAQDYFSEDVDFYVDGGGLAGRLPSTVIRIVDDAIEVLRPGAVKVPDNE